MIAALKQFLRRRRRAALEDEITRLRALRISLQQREMELRGRLAVLGGSV